MAAPESPTDEPAHDVLAAEAFAMPAPAPELHHGQIVLPEDLTGSTEPRDVLAAEEFPMPVAPRAGTPGHGAAGGELVATPPGGGVWPRRGTPGWRKPVLLAAGAAGFACAWLLRRLRRRRRG